MRKTAEDWSREFRDIAADVLAPFDLTSADYREGVEALSARVMGHIRAEGYSLSRHLGRRRSP